MTDQDRPDEPDLDQPGPDQPDADGADDAWVRDLLADARVTGPVPDGVAARLDETLASLREDRLGAADPAVVVPLRRRLAPLLAAAAAVLVVAGGAVGVTQLGRDHAETSGSAADSVTADAGASSRAPEERTPAGAAGAVLPRLGRATFARDAATVMRTLTVDTTSTTDGSTGATPGADAGQAPGQAQSDSATKGLAPPVTTTPAPEALVAPVTACPGPRVSGAVTVPAVLDETPVALVFRPPTATGQRVEAWSCDGTSLLASATVPH